MTPPGVYVVFQRLGDGEWRVIGEERSRTLAAGAVILSGLQHHLGTPLKVVRAGLRDGALLALAAEQAAAAA